MKAEQTTKTIVNLKDIKDKKEKEKLIFSYINPDIEKLRTPDMTKKVATCCLCCKKKPLPPQPYPHYDFKKSLDPDFKLKSVVLIYNPFSGNGRGGKNFPIMESTLKENKIEIVKIFKTERNQHAKEIAENAEEINKADAVICTGGDGTLNEVINGLQLRKQRQQDQTMKIIGYVAGGTANDTAEILYGRKERFDVKKVMEQIINGKPYGFDLIKVVCQNTKTQKEDIQYSHMCALWGIGVQANITADKFRCLGKLRYDVGAFTEILKSKNKHEVTIQVDENNPFKINTSIIFILNSQFLADSLRACPAAKVDDGYLDLIIFDDCGICQTLDAFDELKREGSHIYDQKCVYGHFKKLSFKTEKPTQIQFDGEDERKFVSPFTCEIVEKEMHILH